MKARCDFMILLCAVSTLSMAPFLLADGPPWPEDRNVKDFWKAYFNNFPVCANHDYWVFEADFNGDGLSDTFISSDSSYQYVPQRGWRPCLSEPSGKYTVLSSELMWDLNEEGVITPVLPELGVQALVIPKSGRRRGRDGEQGDIVRYRVTYVDVSLPGLHSMWIEELYPGKTDEEMSAWYQKAKTEGVRPKPQRVFLKDLAKKYHIIVFDNWEAYQREQGQDPGLRWIGPGLPEKGVPIPWQKGAYMPPIDAKILRDALASSGTLSSAPPTTGTMISARPTTLTKNISTTPAPPPQQPPPARAASAPRESESHIPRILIAGVAALVVLGGVFVYSRRRR